MNRTAKKASAIEQMAAAIYENIPARIFETYAELDGAAKDKWRDIARKYFAVERALQARGMIRGRIGYWLELLASKGDAKIPALLLANLRAYRISRHELDDCTEVLALLTAVRLQEAGKRS